MENSEVGMRKSEKQRTEAEDGGRKAEDRILNAEIGLGKLEYGQVTEGRRQRRTDDRGRMTEYRGQTAD